MWQYYLRWHCLHYMASLRSLNWWDGVNWCPLPIPIKKKKHPSFGSFSESLHGVVRRLEISNKLTKIAHALWGRRPAYESIRNFLQLGLLATTTSWWHNFSLMSPQRGGGLSKKARVFNFPAKINMYLVEVALLNLEGNNSWFSRVHKHACVSLKLREEAF